MGAVERIWRVRRPAGWRTIVPTAALLVALPGSALAGSPDQSRPPARDFTVDVLSSRADMVTGGDALVRIGVPRTVPPQRVRVSVDGRDVSDAFAPAPDGPRVLLGLVDELDPGTSTLDVRADGQGRGRPSASVELTDYPITGPVFSGPHQQPFICQTEAFGLGPPLDANCSANTKVEYQYRSSSDGTFKPFDPTRPKPPDLAQTTTTEGHTVDYIVRLETGTINRAVYQIAFLHQPGIPLPNPWTTSPGWNDRLVYTFGGGCDAGYRQGATTGGVLDDGLLSPGFAVVSSSQNVFGNNCNDVISAETAMMVKERFIESFGDPDHTIGFGCSGGSMQVQLIAQNYPGILDGIIPQCSYPDIFTVIPPVVDCSLIMSAVEEGSHSYTLEQLSAVTGYADNDVIETCTLWTRSFSPAWLTPTPCPDVIPSELVYDPATNPSGARCTVHDNTINVLGTDPATGFARRPLDNVGLQYGLKAFNDGVIDFERFAELNELAGGYDTDGNLVPERTVADPEALRIAYQTGRVDSGSGGLADIPIIDVRGYVDGNVDIHDRFRTFSTRERLIAANGDADNYVIWIADRTTTAQGVPHVYEAVALMDEWLTAVGDDDGAGSAADKVVRNKPSDAVDACWTPAGQRINEPATYDGSGLCNQLYPSHADPRLVAGAPLANDVLKCALKPIDPADYAMELSSDQLDRLREVFPDGVCDFTQPGVGQQSVEGTWLRY